MKCHRYYYDDYLTIIFVSNFPMLVLHPTGKTVQDLMTFPKISQLKDSVKRQKPMEILEFQMIRLELKYNYTKVSCIFNFI